MSVQFLSTSRVLVIDDRPDEAIPILTELGKIGVGCIYIKGDRVEELPKKPFDGVRLAFLDMRLDESGEAKRVLSKTVAVLGKCIPRTSIPIVVICWTRHPDDVDTFKDMAKSALGIQPTLVFSMQKPTRGEPATWKGLLKEIESILQQDQGMDFIWQWERTVHAAASETTKGLTDVSIPSNNASELTAAWSDGLFAACKGLVKAVGGSVDDSYTISNSLFRAMNELTADRCNHMRLRQPLACVDKIISVAGASLPVDAQARLNGMLLTEPSEPEDRVIRPGNVYMPQKNGRKCIFKRLAIDPQDLLKQMQQQNAGDTFSPILMEISPACDFAQDKLKVRTFIAGGLLPSNKTTKGDHVYVISPILVPSCSQDPSTLIFCKRNVYAVSISDKDIGNRAMFRLRTIPLVDIQVNASMYRARPGNICLS